MMTFSLNTQADDRQVCCIFRHTGQSTHRKKTLPHRRNCNNVIRWAPGPGCPCYYQGFMLKGATGKNKENWQTVGGQQRFLERQSSKLAWLNSSVSVISRCIDWWHASKCPPYPRHTKFLKGWEPWSPQITSHPHPHPCPKSQPQAPFRPKQVNLLEVNLSSKAQGILCQTGWISNMR